MTTIIDTYHVPVLLNESIDGLDIKSDGIYVDVTFGGGGHSREILSRLGNAGHLYSFDQDADAENNVEPQDNFTFVRSNFRYLKNWMRYYGVEGIDGLLADLGVSSHHFDDETRGFSFRFDAPLDMRMNKEAGTTAADIVNTYPQNELEKILRIYGEVDNARRLAQLIVNARAAGEIKTTGELDNAMAPALPEFASHKILAKIYQALRIEVNHEMRSLEKFLEGAAASLKEGGRLSVITYHSLEDRMVKNYIKAGNIQGELKKDFYGNVICPLKALTRKPVLPQESEIAANTRARSAKLRVAEKEAENES